MKCRLRLKEVPGFGALSKCVKNEEFRQTQFNVIPFIQMFEAGDNACRCWSVITEPDLEKQMYLFPQL